MKRIFLAAGAIAVSAGAASAGPAPATPAGAPAEVAYPVKRGDTLFDLWRAYFTSYAAVQKVARLNRIRDVRRIPTGTVLHIPRALLRDEPGSARIETFSGPVRIDRGGASTPASLGAPLGEGAALLTGRNAFAALRLGDGSVIALPSQSRVRIAWLRKVLLTGALERDFRLEEGRLRTRVTPMTNPASTYRVTTPIAVSAVRGTEFRADYDPTTAFSATEVDGGTVRFVAAGAPMEPAGLALSPGFGAALASGKPTGALALLAPPRLENPEAVQTEPELHFALVPEAGARRYHLLIARDAGMLEAVAEAAGSEPRLTVESLPADSYFVRVSAIDGNGLEGSGETYSFERRRNQISGQLDPLPAGEHRLRFRWEGTADGQPQYRFVLSRSGPSPTPVVDLPGLNETVLAVSNVPPGDYTWRVASTLLVKGQAVTSWTAPQSLHVSR